MPKRGLRGGAIRVTRCDVGRPRSGWARAAALALLAGAVVLAGGRPAGAMDLDDVVQKVREKRDEKARGEAAPSRDEIARNWDAFLTAVIKRAASDTEPGMLRSELLAVLLEERHHIVMLLTDVSTDGPEMVSSLFESSWEPLVPLLERIAAQLPPDAARRYRSFVEAGDLMRAAERLGVARDLAASPESLRKLAGILLGEDAGDPLRFDTAVDPELRALFGFGPPLEGPSVSPLVTTPVVAPGAPIPPARPGEPGAGLVPAGPLGRLAAALGDWLVPPAWASTPPADRAALVARLNTWVPGRKNEVRQYVPLVHDLLRMTAREAQGHRQLEDSVGLVFRDLVITTAWQESCWRQFVRRSGAVKPLFSPAGSVGLMQINAKVWRGIYDAAGLEGDIGYNGRAGSEILWHYLYDHALRGGEHLEGGGADNLARAAYAAYNGGPRHLTRYRKDGTSPDLQEIDHDFWWKYQAVKAGDERKMLACYPTDR